MERKTHINMIKLINCLREGKNLSDAATEAATKYARRVTLDTQLQASIRQSFHADLADRDIKRCGEVGGVRRTPAVPIIEARPVPIAEVKKPKLTPKEIEELETHGILVYLGGQRVYSVRGEAWKAAGRPPLDTFVYERKPSSTPVTPTPKTVTAPYIPKSPIALREVPFEQTEAGENATQYYWNEFHKPPPEDFDLRAWWEEYRKQFARKRA